MGLLERALLIKEIDQSFQTISQEKASFNDRVKAEFHLKEIRENEKYSVNTVQNTPSKIPANLIAEYFLQTTLYQSSYRGCFSSELELKEKINQYPSYGWGLLVKADEQWQAWLIIQANKPAIHSSWKSNIEEAYAWILQQEKLFKCLVQDQAIDMTKDIDGKLVLQFQQGNLDNLNKPIITRQAKKIELETFEANIYPIDYIDAFKDQLYQLKFENKLPYEHYAEFIYLKTSNQSIIYSPIYIAELIDEQGKFVKYLILFGTSNIEQTINLLDALSDHQKLWLSSIKSCNWLTFKTYFLSVSGLFKCFIEHTQAIWLQNNTYPFIPVELIKTVKMITFEEAEPDIHTPLILLNDNQKYRVIHGVLRLGLKLDEIAYPFIQFDRDNNLMNWQNIQTLINQLPRPIVATHLLESLKQYLSKSK